MGLTVNQLSDLEGTRQDLLNKALIINTAIDVQVILQLMVQKGIVTREEVADMRAKVSTSDPKLSSSKQWLDEAIKELKFASENPQWVLKKMFEEKLKK